MSDAHSAMPSSIGRKAPLDLSADWFVNGRHDSAGGNKCLPQVYDKSPTADWTPVLNGSP
jgi:hypothetical protein